jgi:hypothetical protein
MRYRRDGWLSLNEKPNVSSISTETYNVNEASFFAFTHPWKNIIHKHHGLSSLSSSRGAYSFEIQLDLIPKSFHGLHMQRSSRDSTGIIHNNVDRSNILLNLCYRFFDCRLFRNIARIRENFCPLRLTDLLCFGEILKFQVKDNDISTSFGKRCCDCLSDSSTTAYKGQLRRGGGGGTCNYSDAALEFPDEAGRVDGRIDIGVDFGFFYLLEELSRFKLPN